VSVCRWLAELIALEWQSQRARIIPSTMPAMSIAVNAIDLIRPNPTDYLKHFQSNILIDHICIRVSSPQSLVSLQKKHWNPIIEWINNTYNLNYSSSYELAAPQISSQSVSNVNKLLSHQSEWMLSTLDNVTTLTKSFAIALALITGRISTEEAYEAARLEENYQIKQYGLVEGIYGHSVDIDFIKLQLAVAKSFANLLNYENM
jgi:ATP synthase F1 complex assembly factor 2